MRDYLFQLTLYYDGTIRYDGREPKDLGDILRLLAQAADAGEIQMSELRD